MIATLGLAVVFGLMGVINLAHGEFLMLGAYAALLSTRAGLPFWAAIIVAVILTAAFGALVEVLLIRRLYNRILDTMLATWGLSLVLYQAAVVVFGAVTPGLGFSFPSVYIGAYGISAYLLGPDRRRSVLLTAALYVLLTRTSYGCWRAPPCRIRRWRRRSALMQPGSTRRHSRWAVACGLRRRRSCCRSLPATPGMGFAFVVKAFLGVVVAGPLALSGTVIASGVLGALANVTASIWSAVFGDLLFFGGDDSAPVVVPPGHLAEMEIEAVSASVSEWRSDRVSPLPGRKCDALSREPRRIRDGSPPRRRAGGRRLGILDSYLAYVATSWVIFGLLGLSLDLVWGRAGVLSLGQTTFYGIGGYLGSVVAINLAPLTGNTLIWSLPSGALAGACGAGLIGLLIFFGRMGALQATILHLHCDPDHLDDRGVVPCDRGWGGDRWRQRARGDSVLRPAIFGRRATAGPE